MNSPFLTLPAISVSQPVGQFFLCSIAAEHLLKITYSIPASMKRESGMFAQIFGNQRAKSDTRIKQIGAYIDETESTFPNTIILSANYAEDGSYVADEASRWHALRNPDGSFSLIIPTQEKLASIIDGQHRLQGFTHIENLERLKMELPCAVYINLPREYQAKIFATININQKRVDKSLAYQLFGYDLNASDSDKWPPDMLGVYIARVLEGRQGSPFKGHIKLALLEEDELQAGKGGSWKVSVACLVEGITGLISAKPIFDRNQLAQGQIKDRSQLDDDSAPLRDLYREGKDKSLLELVCDFFLAAEEKLWPNQDEKSFITRTIGVLALFDVLKEALKEGKVNRDDALESSKKLLAPAEDVDFSDGYFHASGGGRVRIRNVLKILTGVGRVSDESAISTANRLKGVSRVNLHAIDPS